MSLRSHLRPSREGRRGRRLTWWAIGTPVVALVSGALFAVSGANSDGTDLRPGRYTGMSSLVEADAARLRDIQDQIQQVSTQIEALASANGSGQVKELQGRIDGVEHPAGLRPVSGAGVRITLSDAPTDLIEAYSGNPNDLLVHQQDIQAVVNALWRGGAKAVTIEGQRIITTTGIKCSGSTVQLQGVPYPAPYDIEAVGNPAMLIAALDADPYIAGYRRVADNPDQGLGWEMSEVDRVHAPGYDALLGLRYAEPITGTGNVAG